MSLAQDIELPSPEVMAQRAMSVTGCEDDVLVGQMVRVVNDMSDFMRKNGIVDGSCGMRSLIDWILSTATRILRRYTPSYPRLPPTRTTAMR